MPRQTAGPRTAGILPGPDSGTRSRQDAGGTSAEILEDKGLQPLVSWKKRMMAYVFDMGMDEGVEVGDVLSGGVAMV